MKGKLFIPLLLFEVSCCKEHVSFMFFHPFETQIGAFTVCAVQIQRSPVTFLPGWDEVQDESDSPTFQFIIMA